MGIASKAVTLFASLLLIGHAGGMGRPLDPPQEVPIEAPEVAEQGFYEPHRDPSIYFAEDAARFTSETLFGWHDAKARWNLTLDERPNADGFATGSNDFGQPFTLDAAIFIQRPEPMPGYPAGSCLRGIWTGALSTSAGTVVAWGLTFTVPKHGTTIVPLMILRDQGAAWERFSVLVEAGREIDPRYFQCALDEAAFFQARQNAIAQEACVNSVTAWYAGGIVFCTVAGGVSCWISFGVGCAAGFICDLMVLGSAMLWNNAYYEELARANSCLCLETQWREKHPGQPLPADSCGKFTCPGFVLLPIRL